MKLKTLVASTLLVTATAIAGSLQDLNDAIKVLLVDFNNAQTSAGITFTDMEVSATRAVKLGGQLHYLKTINNNSASLHADFNYSYPEAAGAVPTTNATADLDLDVVKLLGGQDNFNQQGDEAEELVKEFIQEYTKTYGPAADVNAHASKVVDANGDLDKVAIDLQVKIDLDKLPTDVSRDSVMGTEINIQAVISRHLIHGTALLVSNPEYSAFQEDQAGLKEWIEAMLNQNADMMNAIKELIGLFDRGVEEFLSH